MASDKHDKDRAREREAEEAAREKEAKRASARAGVEPQAITPGTWPSPIDAFRAAVAGVAVTVVNPAAGDALLPYPTGTPLPVGSAFWLRNGYYKSATPT